MKTVKNMIRASFYKLFHDKATWICLAGTVVWSLQVGLALIWIADEKPDLSDVMALEKFWMDFINYQAAMIPLLVSSIVLFTSEYKDKSWKLLIAKGASQAGYFFAKLLCILCLEVLICTIAILTGAAFTMLYLSVPMSAAYIGLVLRYLVAQLIAHGTMAVLILTVSFLVRNSEVSSSINMILMIFGTMALSKLEGALKIGDALTGCWAFAQHFHISFCGDSAWSRLILVFVGYLAVCSLAAILFSARRDVE